MSSKIPLAIVASALIIAASIVAHGWFDRYTVAQAATSSGKLIASRVLLDKFSGTACFFPKGGCYTMTNGRLEQASAWWENEHNFVPASNGKPAPWWQKYEDQPAVGSTQIAKPWERYQQKPTLTPVEGNPFEGDAKNIPPVPDGFVLDPSSETDNK